MNDSNSSRGLRPSRKFMTMVNKIRQIDQKPILIETEEKCEIRVLDDLLNNVDSIYERTNHSISKYKDINDSIYHVGELKDTKKQLHSMFHTTYGKKDFHSNVSF
jgi:hypothetical protein